MASFCRGQRAARSVHFEAAQAAAQSASRDFAVAVQLNSQT